jgi:hypothetical protein
MSGTRPLREIEGLRFADEVAVDAGQAVEVRFLSQHPVSKLCNREVGAPPRSRGFSEPIGRIVGSCESRSASLKSSQPTMRL